MPESSRFRAEAMLISAMRQIAFLSRIARSIRLRSACTVSAGILLSQAGCVAFNIPSERHFDPRDGGGLLGDWKKPVHPGRLIGHWISDTPNLPGHAPGVEIVPETGLSHHHGETFVDPGHLSHPSPANCFGDDLSGQMIDSAGGTSPPPPPEVPWPRYHGVPTRPVFSGANPSW